MKSKIKNVKTVEIKKKLLSWYKTNARDFPWRNTADPYKVMIAEFMLHRTKAEQVLPAYTMFIQEFPDIYHLEKATENDIKKYILNLGLQWRFRHFIESAKFIIKNLNGIFPDDYRKIREIPGIGEYISCAISIIAFKKGAPVVDSNIARFFNRIFNLKLNGEIRRRKEIVQKANDFFKTTECNSLLFALIDFCASVCKPRTPKCLFCCLRKYCEYDKKFNVES